MAHVDRIRLYPVKALDGQDVETARVTEAGLLAGDREYALVGPAGDPVNGKRTARVHDLATDFDRETGRLTVTVDERAARATGGANDVSAAEPASGERSEPRAKRAPPDARAGSEATREREEFSLPDERDAAADWFSGFFDLDVSIRRDATRGFVDRRSGGPSVVSTATLREVASWDDDLTVGGVRRRLRANVEVAGVEPFWEDRFVGADAPAFEVGGVRFEGAEPCGRCVVPERDPETGVHDPGFRERFVRKRRATLPGWADEDAFDHLYAVMLIAAVPPAHRESEVEVGDAVRVVE